VQKKPKMEVHFDDARWTDFVRGLAGESVSRAIQAHLDARCESCCAMLSWLEHVQRLGSADARESVPDYLVRSAQEIFTPREKATGWIDKLEAMTGELVSSFGRNWQLAGVRATEDVQTAEVDRMLFRAGQYFMDLRLEPPSALSAGEITGQIYEEGDSGDNLDGIVVQLVVPGRILDETTTNRFGEFLLGYPERPSTTVRFALKHRMQRIDLPLRLKQINR
jgi:hypothetical protein